MSPAASTEQPVPATGRASAVVAMVGAGQLARMTHQAAIALGLRLRVLGAHGDAAVDAGAWPVPGSPGDLGDLHRLAAGADVLTFDHEHVPPDLLAALEEEGVAMAPAAAAKRFAQDKLHARRELVARGFPVPPFTRAGTPEDARDFAASHGWPLVAKAPRGGYDGRGVFALEGPRAADRALSRLPDGFLLEPHLAIDRELAILIARTASGDRIAYPVVQTVQRDAMCREILAPAAIDPGVAARVRDLALALADEIGATGVLAVEFFHTRDGELLINELALRPHNSGHYTIEGCVTSQFEQHLRAVLGWPLGSSALLAPAVATVNVVGPADGSDPADRLGRALAVPGAHVHLYGKAPRPGRKLGHVTVCGRALAPAREAARLAAARLEGAER